MVFIWSTAWAFIKIGLKETPPAVGLATRFGNASLALFIFFLISKIIIVITKEHLKLYFIVGIFNIALSYFCTYWGTQCYPSSLSSILWSMMPIMIGLMAHFFIKEERLTLQKVLSIIIAISGVTLILSNQKLIINREILTGSLIVLLAVFMSSFPNIYTKKFKLNFNPLVLTAMAMLIASIFHSINATLTNQWENTVWNLPNIGIFIYFGIFGSSITFYIYFLFDKTNFNCQNLLDYFYYSNYSLLNRMIFSK